MKRFVLFSILILFSIFSPLQLSVNADSKIWNLTLKSYVQDGKVDPQSIELYLESFKNIAWSELTEGTRESQIAFWINVYNALSLKKTLSSVAAPLELKDRKVTHEEIRNEILRRRFRDERVMFALYDATSNGPRLRPEPYQGEKLDAQLDREIRLFIQDPKKNQIKKGEKEIVLSYLFKEYADDFLLNYASYGNKHKKFTVSQMAALSFIAQYASPETVQFLEAGRYKIKYFEKRS